MPRAPSAAGMKMAVPAPRAEKAPANTIYAVRGVFYAILPQGSSQKRKTKKRQRIGFSSKFGKRVIFGSVHGRVIQRFRSPSHHFKRPFQGFSTAMQQCMTYIQSTNIKRSPTSTAPAPRKHGLLCSHKAANSLKIVVHKKGPPLES